MGVVAKIFQLTQAILAGVEDKTGAFAHVTFARPAGVAVFTVGWTGWIGMKEE